MVVARVRALAVLYWSTLMIASSAAAGTGMKKMRASAASRRTMKRDILCLIGILLFAEHISDPDERSFDAPFLR